MSGDGGALAAAAESFIGAPFRLHGRDPHTGLDCVGLCLVALAAIGRSVSIPACYELRNRDITQGLRFARAANLADAAGAALPGDIVLAQLSPVQFHLLIAANGQCFIHAHAGLRRVVATPGPLCAALLRHWRVACTD